MSDPAGEIEAITAELRTIAERLRSSDLGDEDAERLAREAADLVARAGNELERAQTDSRDE
jgi:hypothetical protein